MKKEARIQAEKMFLRAGGKITNKEIAKLLEVNPLTVGRWKHGDDWGSKLKAGGPAAPKDAAVVVRKKAARDKAVQLYMEVGGNVTNKELAKKVRVTPATISKWKRVDGWIDQLTSSEAEARAELKEHAELDIGELASPGQIIQINQRIDSLLKRDYLTSSEVADLAEAKSALLEAVDIYLAIVRDVGEMKSQD
jgi:uncharacterized protein YjcR